ncbi:DNA polymerase nu isoform X2 [Solea solea]|uniref:DNA polymerase nu isoform X2 n=1 Tax=Solea solea TaxID=90069 RepID=UPI00272A731F|nr:DNA polymerase nu isoform X2 [Solea solea]
MEQSNNLLYSGPLSQAAQKILAVLQAQSKSCNSRKQSQSGRIFDSQREPSLHCSRSMTQDEGKDRDLDWPWSRPQVSSFPTAHNNTPNERHISLSSACYQCPQTPDNSLSSQATSCSPLYWESSLQRDMPQKEACNEHWQAYSHRKPSKSPAHQSSQAPSFMQNKVSEKMAWFTLKDKHALSLQIPARLSGYHCANNEEIRPSFINDLSSGDINPEEHKKNLKEQHNLGCHSVSSSLKVSVDTCNHVSSPLKENKDAKCWDVSNEKEGTVTSDNRLKMKRPPTDPSEEACSGGEDGGVLFQHSESETSKTERPHLPLSGSDISCLANSLNLTRHRDVEEDMRVDRNVEAIGRISHSEHELNIQSIGVHFQETEQMYASLPHKTVSPDEMDGSLLFESNESITASTSSCYSEAVKHRPGLKSKDTSMRCYTSCPKKISLSLERGTDKFLTQSVNEKTEKHYTKWAMMQWESTRLGDTTADHLDRPTGQRVDVMKADSRVDIKGEKKGDNHTGTAGETEQYRFSDIQLKGGQFETCYEEVKEVPQGDREQAEEDTSTEGSGRERCPTPALSHEFWAGELKVPCQHHDNMQSMRKSCKGTSTNISPSPASTFTSGQIAPTVQGMASFAVKTNKNLEKCNQVSTFQPDLYPHSLIASFPLKRKHEALQQQDNPPKICQTRRCSKWEPPCSSQVMMREGIMSGVHPCVPKQMQQRSSKREEGCHEFTSVSKQTPAFMTCKTKSKISCGWDNTGEPQSKAGQRTKSLTSDPRVKDSWDMNMDEKVQMLQMAAQAKTLVLTMVHQDGSTQLNPEQKLTPAVCGLLILMVWSDLDSSALERSLGHNSNLLYLNLSEQKPTHQNQELFTRDMLLMVLSRPKLVVCYKAKDLLRTALQFYKGDLTLKHMAGCHIQDPQVSAWLLDPADPCSCYLDLLNKHYKRPTTTPALGTNKVSQVISGLYSLYWLNLELCSKLQSQGLWELYSDMELNMIPVLAAMESHCIHVDKDALKRTSDLLGTKMKQLEQEAHQAAGQIFLITSNTQLRTVLFEKLRLHERCENKKLPKTINKLQSTSEAALLQLQGLHPLPKIILEYRQIHKIKSTFVDGILSCMMSKDYISSTWHQTSVITGRISAKHPNFQALPRQPLQINRKQFIQGKEEEVLSVHPRAMFIPQKGWTFLAADFCQVELRLLAHLSSDPELLRIFSNPQADVFTMLASQWKRMSEGEVTSEDREHAKRIVYSVVYGAGRERLSGILGVSADQASQFQDSFLQTYKEVHTFIQKTIQLCHKQGYVLSIMGRRRILPNIKSPDWGIRMQAERQAVNFTVQASAADLCKMAMIRIFNLITSSSFVTARLIAQLHDELLYEVQDSQVERFAALVKSTMEALQHIDYLGIHLKVPLKVAISSGKSWGSMSEFNVLTEIPTPPL